MSEPMKDVWNEVAEGFAKLGSVMRDRYRGGTDDAPALRHWGCCRHWDGGRLRAAAGGVRAARRGRPRRWPAVRGCRS